MNKYRIICYIILLFVCSIIISCGKEDPANGNGTFRGSIYGVITDFATGNPVQNANVQLRPSGETTLTGYDGMYEFIDIQDGDYSITVSKAEYTNLIDDYVIEVKDGRRMRRDVQIKKKPTFIRITDSNGNDISTLDFGSDAAVITKSFNIFNNGTVAIHCQMVYSCSWIYSVSSVPDEIVPGQTVPVTVSINRSFLSVGQNSTQLVVSSNNGSAELTIKATSGNGNPPDVELISISNITATSALCKGRVRNSNGGIITDCGFCYSTSSNPSIEDNPIRLGPCDGIFSFTLSDLQNGTTYHVKAFATTDLGTGYSSEDTFPTVTGLPNCGATTITHLDPTTVSARSTAYGTNGYDVIEKGFCWSSSHHNPTINDSKVEDGFGDGVINEYLNPLQPNTIYWVRSYAKSVFGISYGQEKEFTSLSGLATISTASAYLSGDEVITGGNVTDAAGTVIIDRGVCYGSRSNPDLSAAFQHTYDGSGVSTGAFTSRIPRPVSSGYLYIRAYATTRYGTAYGNEVRIYIP